MGDGKGEYIVEPGGAAGDDAAVPAVAASDGTGTGNDAKRGVMWVRLAPGSLTSGRAGDVRGAAARCSRSATASAGDTGTLTMRWRSSSIPRKSAEVRITFMESAAVSPGASTPPFGRTDQRRGAFVFSLKQWCKDVPFERMRAIEYSGATHLTLSSVLRGSAVSATCVAGVLVVGEPESGIEIAR